MAGRGIIGDLIGSWSGEGVISGSELKSHVDLVDSQIKKIREAMAAENLEVV